MRVLICNSKNWFTLDENNKRRLETTFVAKKEDLTISFIREFDPSIYFCTLELEGRERNL